jgi:hypothetical protein
MDIADVFRAQHDGQLVAVSLQSRTILRLKCTPLHGPSIVFEIGGIRDLCATNFRQGNIILDIHICQSIDQLDMLSIQRLAHSETEADMTAYAHRMRQREATDSIRYLVLQCSYGCDVVIAYDGQISIVDAI